MSSPRYLLADQPSELERLQLQSRVWEPSGRRLLDEIGESRGARVLDVGCGAIGWLRLLSAWVGPDGEVVGTDIDDAMLTAAGQFVDTKGLGNVVLTKDDLFASKLESSSFDLVHARLDRTAGSRARPDHQPPQTPPAGRHLGAGGVGCELVAFQPSCACAGESDRAHRPLVGAVRRRRPGGS
jgi:SAM-dependent methyltransferase